MPFVRPQKHNTLGRRQTVESVDGRIADPAAGAAAEVPRRKLIEVALPLEVINRESAREKSIRHGHPSTLHLWWARRPLAAARAVLFAQLVDDPSSFPDRFPTEEAQRVERERLHGIIERLVVWENVRDEKLLAEAHAEILASTDGNPPPILDPFAGGGTIPLEAQRLGLEAHASDLNPVAVLINKALIEIPPKFRDRRPVYPGLADSEVRSWRGAEGLAADVRAYGAWMRDEAERRIGHLYPKAALPDGTEATVIAWIWARTVTCPNPACGIDMPLVRSWWLGKKKGKETFVVPSVVGDASHPSGLKVAFDIGYGAAGPSTSGTMERGHGTCIACSTVADNKYIRTVATSRGLESQLMAIVVEGRRQRTYLAASAAQVMAAQVVPPMDVPDQLVTTPNHDVDRLPMYGMPRWADAFTARQLVALTTFSDLVAEARERVLADVLTSGTPAGQRLEQGGSDAEAYADAVATYLGLAASRCTDYFSTINTWASTGEFVRNVFARQAIPMAWDFAETNPYSSSTGNFVGQVTWTASALEGVAARGTGVVGQADASRREINGVLISTDPPYYDNIGYSDLSDYFYVWQRRTLRRIHPNLLGTMLVPKAEELVANPYRHGGKNGAKDFFEDGFREVFRRARETALPDFPITVYYAFKQGETTEVGDSSSGWETLLEGMIRSGWAITATWPMRSERSGRMISVGTNALASSIVLSLRPRPADAPTIDRRGFIAALKAELPPALKELQQGNIAAVDLSQAVIGPGMAVFSRYSGVLEADGKKMTVRSALARINEILDEVLVDQEGDFDTDTRFAIAWYRQHGYTSGPYGAADLLARARSASVDRLDRLAVLTKGGGKVTLLRPTDLPEGADVAEVEHLGVWQVLHHVARAMDADGVPAAGAVLASVASRADVTLDTDLVKELAYLLFGVAGKAGWTKDAIAFDQIVTSWPEILDASRNQRPTATQGAFDFDDEN